MKNKIIVLLGMSLLLLAMGCKKEDSNGNLKAVFSYTVHGFVANFTNFTDFNNYHGPYATYHWDFGDGDTSSAVAPSHVYSEIGNFVVKLTAEKGNQVSSFSDTLSVAGPDITIDGDFSDWKHVAVAATNESGNSTLLSLKAFSKGDSLYFYFVGTPDFNANSPIHFFFDSDGDTSTGFLVSDYPGGSGAEYMYEGSMFGYGNLFKFESTGDRSDFGGWVSIADQDNGPIGFNFSQIQNLPNGNHAMEFSVGKSVIGNPKKKAGVAIVDLSSGYDNIGYLPESDVDSAKFLMMDL